MTEKQTQAETKPKLEVGKEYLVSLYPIAIGVRAKYLGHKDKEIPYIATDFFVFEENGEKNYILMEDNWMREIEGRITYTPISSSVVDKITEKDLKEEQDEKLMRHIDKQTFSKLLKILRDLGEDI